MDIKQRVTVLLNILQVLCELAERDATFFLPRMVMKLIMKNQKFI